MKEGLLISGGVDSVVGWYYLKKKPMLIYVDLKTDYTHKELKCLEEIKKIDSEFNYTVVKNVNLGQFQKGEKAYILHRNLILCSIASNYVDKVWLCGIKDDLVDDKNEMAFACMEYCLNFIEDNKLSKMRIKLASPFWTMGKSEIVKWMIDNVKDGEKILRASVSCYSSARKQCGNCPSCLRKAVSFAANNLSVDFFVYDVTKNPYINSYIKAMTCENSKYNKDRIDESLKVFKQWGYNI